MNPQTTNNLSYYRLLLLSFLSESHPELASKPDFITARSEQATNVYAQAIEQGGTHQEAEELASEVLYRGLHFSKHDTLVTILWNEFADEVPQSEAKMLAATLLPHCQTIFANYPLSDDFAYTAEFEALYAELTGTILIYLEELQDDELQ